MSKASTELKNKLLCISKTFRLHVNQFETKNMSMKIGGKIIIEQVICLMNNFSLKHKHMHTRLYVRGK